MINFHLNLFTNHIFTLYYIKNNKLCFELFIFTRKTFILSRFLTNIYVRESFVLGKYINAEFLTELKQKVVFVKDFWLPRSGEQLNLVDKWWQNLVFKHMLTISSDILFFLCLKIFCYNLSKKFLYSWSFSYLL